MTSFNSMDEAIAKIRTGQPASTSSSRRRTLGRLVVGKVLQPLNHELPPEPAERLASVQDPLYDQASRYTVPYTAWTTGIGYRADKVSTTPGTLSNPTRSSGTRQYLGELVPPRRRTRRDRHGTCC